MIFRLVIWLLIWLWRLVSCTCCRVRDQLQGDDGAGDDPPDDPPPPYNGLPQPEQVNKRPVAIIFWKSD